VTRDGQAAEHTIRIAVDTGGTFTDVVVTRANGSLASAKAPTRFDDPWVAINEALAILAAEAQISVGELLSACEMVSYATTRATNAILTGTTARTAFVTTEGFPDILTLRNGGRADPFDFATAFPEPYVPRALTFELAGRINAQGVEVRPFAAAAAERVCRRIVETGCEAVAVCLLWAHANATHEHAFAAVLASIAPGLPVTLSHQLNPVIREYPRASSCAIDASLKPLMQHHFASLEQSLTDAGFTGELLAVTSAGGCLPFAQIIDRPVYAIDSGPSVAPVAAKTYARADADMADVVVYDTGGTSFDVTLIRDGQVTTSRDRWLGGEFTGHLLGINAVGVHSIGAGGGSIAWIDDGGLLRVGPHSAGSEPGPVCYARGGREPTVTDAAVVCGYLDPDYFLGGRLRLDRDAARDALSKRIAAPLALSTEQAARAVLVVADELMVGAIREITVNQGVDPRECLLVAGGGAGGMNVVNIARELGCRHALVPRAAGTLSAVGAQFADLVCDFTRSAVMSTAAFDADRAELTLRELDLRIDAFISELHARDVQVTTVDREFAVEARYPDQVWDLRVPIAYTGSTLAADAVDRTVTRFHDLHQRTFAVSDERLPIECQQWTGRVTVHLPKPSAGMHLGGEKRAPDTAVRTAWFDGRAVDTRIVPGVALAPGDVVQGPAIIEEPTTTVVVPPRASARVTTLGSYLISPEVN
jgi:N-methylhydantoinase A